MHERRPNIFFIIEIDWQFLANKKLLLYPEDWQHALKYHQESKNKLTEDFILFPEDVINRLADDLIFEKATKSFSESGDLAENQPIAWYLRCAQVYKQIPKINIRSIPLDFHQKIINFSRKGFELLKKCEESQLSSYRQGTLSLAMGICYQYGYGVERDWMKACQYYCNLIMQPNTDKDHFLVALKQLEKIAAKNIPYAFGPLYIYYLKIADKSRAEAIRNKILDCTPVYTRAKVYQSLAIRWENQSAVLIKHVANCFDDGYYSTYEKKVKKFYLQQLENLATSTQHPSAYYYLGSIYQEANNNIQAFYWYTLILNVSQENFLTESAFKQAIQSTQNLGIMNIKKTYSQNICGNWYPLTPDELKYYLMGMYQLGLYYQNHLGQYQKAKKCFIQATSHTSEAFLQLGRLHLQKKLADASIPEGIDYYFNYINHLEEQLNKEIESNSALTEEINQKNPPACQRVLNQIEVILIELDNIEPRIHKIDFFIAKRMRYFELVHSHVFKGLNKSIYYYQQAALAGNKQAINFFYSLPELDQMNHMFNVMENFPKSDLAKIFFECLSKKMEQHTGQANYASYTTNTTRFLMNLCLVAQAQRKALGCEQNIEQALEQEKIIRNILLRTAHYNLTPIINISNFDFPVMLCERLDALAISYQLPNSVIDLFDILSLIIRVTRHSKKNEQNRRILDLCRTKSFQMMQHFYIKELDATTKAELAVILAECLEDTEQQLHYYEEAASHNHLGACLIVVKNYFSYYQHLSKRKMYSVLLKYELNPLLIPTLIYKTLCLLQKHREQLSSSDKKLLQIDTDIEDCIKKLTRLAKKCTIAAYYLAKCKEQGIGFEANKELALQEYYVVAYSELTKPAAEKKESTPNIEEKTYKKTLNEEQLKKHEKMKLQWELRLTYINEKAYKKILNVEQLKEYKKKKSQWSLLLIILAKHNFIKNINQAYANLVDRVNKCERESSLVFADKKLDFILVDLASHENPYCHSLAEALAPDGTQSLTKWHDLILASIEIEVQEKLDLIKKFATLHNLEKVLQCFSNEQNTHIPQTNSIPILLRLIDIAQCILKQHHEMNRLRKFFIEESHLISLCEAIVQHEKNPKLLKQLNISPTEEGILDLLIFICGDERYWKGKEFCQQAKKITYMLKNAKTSPEEKYQRICDLIKPKKSFFTRSLSAVTEPVVQAILERNTQKLIEIKQEMERSLNAADINSYSHSLNNV